ncbi:MAG: hypothetical protein AB7Y46_08020 [Armatimonadota bacterium]
MANSGVPALPEAVQDKLNRMCPVAKDAQLGALLAAVKAMLEDHEATLADHEARIAALEGP